ncbi:DNA polymerase IV [Chitinimonas lacunae]|uniref:DNA polymerase IV n=1 Tax=Chitinimonas lacunae TaxID=1963018 RepID=A0ABV8MIH2_9NEIS
MRKIIHIDCDCFYASVETRENPSLRGRPMAVGGDPQRRGVIATCNYEARRFGVRSAMASGYALKLCPDLILLPPRFELYRAVSHAIHAIYHDYSDLIEPLSLDEAFLDVSGLDHCRGSATLMAAEIRSRIEREIGITASAGIAPNKFVAKIASDWNKPNGQFVVRPEELDAFVAALPVEKIFGVGKVTAAKLRQLGAVTCADLREWPLTRLVREFGRFGERLYELCRGIDERPVAPDRPRKSLSVENTYAYDLRGHAVCHDELLRLIDDLRRRLERTAEEAPIHKAFVKIRFTDFSQTTVECVDTRPDRATWQRLLDQGLARSDQAVRLLGVGVRFEERKAVPEQLSLW